MPCVKRNFFAFALLAAFTLFPSVSFASPASGTCECFCGAPVTGAVDMNVMTNAACQAKCIDVAKTIPTTKFVGCYSDPQYYPDRNPKCWTKDDCDVWSGKRGNTTINASWDTGPMPYECMKNKTSEDPMSYCYADDTDYTLNVAIGSVTSVKNLPTYINLIYAWLLPAGALIAVVMMMLGGLQYVLSRGKSKYIEKSKTRITNAITGLVILLSVFVLLNLIDPRLTALNTLKIPMIKEVTLLDANSSCERLQDYGYDVMTVKGSNTCGGTGQISDDSGLIEGVLGSWKKGDKCEYSACNGADAGKSCVADGNTKVCKLCAELPNPSESICKTLDAVIIDGVQKIECVYDSTANSCVTAGKNLPNDPALNCTELQAYANEEVSTGIKRGCSVYETLKYGYTTVDAASGNRSDGIYGALLNSSEASARMLKTVCTEDFCKIAKFIDADHCGYNVGSQDAGYVADALNYFYGTSINTTGYFCHTF